ncbi:hypothetical protein [Nocardia blacklockiae]|uniref:hypothetical protein n=1 Tax=Nocardia blacklockiae TaxID=480036 RepID=UPI00189395DA|nr:hypothetical protein [Nocardia blacklockiae]MBF6173743.1 hypothetical protein [Nocardia blacklockiae]
MADEDVAKWQKLAEQARSGVLYLNDEAVARECLAACDQRLTDLNDLATIGNITQRVSGFGDFDMGRALESGFLKQATGEPNSIDQIIRDHIETVKNMREVMALSIKQLTGQDVDNAGEIGATDPAGR